MPLINKEQASRLQKYVEMTRRNEKFSQEEAQDFYNLGKLLTEERFDDKGAWAIHLFASIIYFMTINEKRENCNISGVG